MAISYFAYAVEGDSILDGDMIRMQLEPDSVPMYAPYGQEFRAGDGQPLYAGPPSVTLHWQALPFDTDTQGVAATTGTIKSFYADWERARDYHKQRFTVNFFDPNTNDWVKKKCVILWPDWSGKEFGSAFMNFDITLVAVGINLADSGTPTWGESSPVAYSEDKATLGDELVGAIGYGLIGRGLIGRGSAS